MFKKSIVFAVLMCAVVALGAAELALAQATETVKIRATGTLMGRSGDTIVVSSSKALRPIRLALTARRWRS